MAIQKIPLYSETTAQSFSVVLSDNPYILDVVWNELFGYFSLTIKTIDDVVILSNIKMVKDYPLIGRFKSDLLPSGEFYFIQEQGLPKRPAYSDLAVSFNLFYVESE